MRSLSGGAWRDENVDGLGRPLATGAAAAERAVLDIDLTYSQQPPPVSRGPVLIGTSAPVSQWQVQRNPVLPVYNPVSRSQEDKICLSKFTPEHR